MLQNIAIIGSAGRGPDVKYMNPSKFESMVNAVETMLYRAGYTPSNIELHSGGAAFSDHVAVVIALKYGCHLHLHLPAGFCSKSIRYNLTNPGITSNICHANFSHLCKRDSLEEIKTVISLPTTKVTIYDGFFARNRGVALAPILIAFSRNDQPKDGGTAYTYKLAKGYKCCLSLE